MRCFIINIMTALAWGFFTLWGCAAIAQPASAPAEDAGIAASVSAGATLTTLHAFHGGRDGDDPLGGLAADEGGNLYGTTYYDGLGPYNGTVFMLKRPKAQGGQWTYSVIYRFSPSYWDGNGPTGDLTVRKGVVYGTTHGGANPSCGCGEVFRLRPLNAAKTQWKYSIIHRFNNANTGSTPESGVVFGPDGALYGTTSAGGRLGAGIVFKLTGSGDAPWAFTLLRNLPGDYNGGPQAEVLFGNNGTLYGTTFGGGKYNRGTVFSLTKSGAFKIIYDFKGVDQPGGSKDGADPEARLIFGTDGALYGTTVFGGESDSGTIFRLKQDGAGKWSYSIAHHFIGGDKDGTIVHSRLVLDRAGNFYGTASGSGHWGGGVVYKLARSGTKWSFQVLHSFVPRNPHGDIPSTDLVLNRGALYATTLTGGDIRSGDCTLGGCGTVYELR